MISEGWVEFGFVLFFFQLLTWFASRRVASLRFGDGNFRIQRLVSVDFDLLVKFVDGFQTRPIHHQLCESIRKANRQPLRDIALAFALIKVAAALTGNRWTVGLRCCWDRAGADCYSCEIRLGNGEIAQRMIGLAVTPLPSALARGVERTGQPVGRPRQPDSAAHQELSILQLRRREQAGADLRHRLHPDPPQRNPPALARRPALGWDWWR